MTKIRFAVTPSALSTIRKAAKRRQLPVAAYIRLRALEAAERDLVGVVVTGAVEAPIAPPSTTPIATPEPGTTTTTSEITPEQLAEYDRRAAAMLERMKAAKPAS